MHQNAKNIKSSGFLRKIFLFVFIFAFSGAVFYLPGEQAGQGNHQYGTSRADEVYLAQADEWVCEDSDYPVNCNNGTCCESGAKCCHLHCCHSGALCCPSGCCPSGYPWFCPENNRCYERYDDGSVKCGSILQKCN